MAYPDLTDTTKVKARLGIAADNFEDDALLASLIVAVSAYVQERTGSFVADAVTEYHDGQNYPKLCLRRWPVDTIAAISESRSIPRNHETPLVADTDYILDSASGIVTRMGSKGWAAGPNAVLAVYLPSFEIPADLIEAVHEIIAEKFRKGKDQLYHLTNEQRADGEIQGITPSDVPSHAREVIEFYARRRGLGL